MARIKIIGKDVFYNGYKVATLTENYSKVPIEVMESFKGELVRQKYEDKSECNSEHSYSDSCFDNNFLYWPSDVSNTNSRFTLNR